MKTAKTPVHVRLLTVGVTMTLTVILGCSSASAEDPCNPPKQILVKRVVPPSANPYPPETEGDRARTALAEAIITGFYSARLDESELRRRLQVPHDPALDDPRPGPEAFPFAAKSAACLRDIVCWSKDYAFLRRVVGLASMSPPWLVDKVIWSHVAPWSRKPAAEVDVRGTRADYLHTTDPDAFVLSRPKLKEGEVVVDAAVTMKGREGYWHLLLVVADDLEGVPGVKWFQLEPIQDITRWSCHPK